MVAMAQSTANTEVQHTLTLSLTWIARIHSQSHTSTHCRSYNHVWWDRHDGLVAKASAS